MSWKTASGARLICHGSTPQERSRSSSSTRSMPRACSGQILEYMQSPESVRAQAAVLDRAQQIAEGNRALDSQIADLRSVFDQAPGLIARTGSPRPKAEL